MPCVRFKTENGAVGIVCLSRGPRKRCACGQPAPFLCDWKVPSKRSGTCDAPLCARCAHEPADDKHLCPTHAAEWKGRRR